MPNQGDVANVYAFVILHLGLLHTSGNTRDRPPTPHPNKPAIDRALVGDPGSALMSQRLKANVAPNLSVTAERRSGAGCTREPCLYNPEVASEAKGRGTMPACAW